jgi:hypothetical protein
MFLCIFVFARARARLRCRSHYRIGDNLANVLGRVGGALVLFFCLIGLLSAGGGRVVIHLCREENMKAFRPK